MVQKSVLLSLLVIVSILNVVDHVFNFTRVFRVDLAVGFVSPRLAVVLSVGLDLFILEAWLVVNGE